MAVRADTSVLIGVDRSAAERAQRTAFADDVAQLSDKNRTLVRGESHARSGLRLFFLVPEFVSIEYDGPVRSIEAEPDPANAKIVLSGDRKVTQIGRARFLVKVDLREHLRKREVKCLELLLLHPERGRLGPPA